MLEKIASQFPETRTSLLQYDVLWCLMKILTRWDKGMIVGVVGLMLCLLPNHGLLGNGSD